MSRVVGVVNALLKEEDKLFVRRLTEDYAEIRDDETGALLTLDGEEPISATYKWVGKSEKIHCELFLSSSGAKEFMEIIEMLTEGRRLVKALRGVL